MIRILLVDDQVAVRQKLKLALERQADFAVVGTAAQGDEALEKVAVLQPDVVLMDLEMPGTSGLEATALVRDRFPQVRVIILSSNDDGDSIRTAIHNGACGYVAKQKLDASMVDIIRSVHQGRSQFGPGLLEKALNSGSALAITTAPGPIQAPPPVDGGDLLTPDTTSALVIEDSQLFTTAAPSRLEVYRTRLTDWSSSAKEIIDTVPLPWTRGLFYCLLGTMAIAIPWAMIFQMDEIGTARGRLELTGETIKLEADLPGNATVTKVLVKKGDLVTPNQVLMELDSKEVRDQIQQVQVKLEGQQQRLNQLQVSKNQMALALTTQDQQNQAQLTEKQAQIAQAEQNLASLKTSYNNQESEKNAQVAQAAQAVRDRQVSSGQQQQERANLVAQAQQTIRDNTTAYNIAKTRLVDAQREVTRYANLQRQGAIAEVRTREAESLAKERNLSTAQSQANLQQAQLRLQEQQATYRKTMAQAQSEIQQAQLRLKEQQGSYQRTLGQLQGDVAQSQLRLQEQQSSLATLQQSHKLALVKSEQQLKEVQSQVATLENEIAQNRQQERVLTDRLGKYTIRAKGAGRIFELPVTREGAVMQPKQLIAEIAPTAGSEASLIFKGEIPAAESESLRAQGVGKAVRLKLDEFPFETYGIVTGKLAWIAPNSTVSTNPGASRVTYEVKIALDRACINYQKQCLPFSSGQPGTAEIIIRRRRIIDLILDPFTKLKGS